MMTFAFNSIGNFIAKIQDNVTKVANILSSTQESEY